MPDYDLNCLGSRAFEQLIVALCHVEIGSGVQAFGDGPDGGREATFDGTIRWSATSEGVYDPTGTWMGYTVVQSKFQVKPKAEPRDNAMWLRSEISREIDGWVTAARAGTRSRLPDYLIFATNVDLSAVATTGGIDTLHDFVTGKLADKATLAAGLRMKGFRIWYADQIRSMIDAHPAVRQSFPGLLTVGDVLAYGARPHLVRSPYLELVSRMAPAELLDRDEELAQLAEFCTEDGGAGYMYWTAPAWAGKSALMSWFVLHPPRGVRLVSFFITTRWAGLGDRTAFANVLLEQLADLLGEPMPPFLTEANRETHLWRQLAEAARWCEQRGERLVLLVDGLDEDLGVTVGPEAYSIAALLPVSPPAGMRVVVAGRPYPGIPWDVPDDHPLCEKGSVRRLSKSEHAEVVRVDAERALGRLRDGSRVERDLLCLVTASGGGLSGSDLAELTGLSLQDIEDHLRGVSGRSFARQVSRWRADAASEVYVLCHEEIRQTALRYVGPRRLAEGRDRLGAWAERYRAAGWPPDTPEYLLNGYQHMLRASSSLTEMVRCATDAMRHDRMLDISGGDAAALAEVRDALDLVAGQPDPDLLAAGRLARHRDELAARNTNIPPSLAVAWTLIGKPARAEAMVRGIAEPFHRDAALASIAAILAETGAVEEAATLADGIMTPADRATALAHVAMWQIRHGGHAKTASLLRAAATIAEKLEISSVRHDALTAIMEAHFAGGEVAEAEELARRVSDPDWLPNALHGAVKGWIGIGVMDIAEATARGIPDPYWHAVALNEVAEACFVSGDHDRATALISETERLAQQITHPQFRDWALTDVARTLVHVGQADRAEQLASSLRVAQHRIEALANVAAEVGLAGDGDRADLLFRKASDAGRRLKGMYRIEALDTVARHLVRAGRHDAAQRMAARSGANSKDEVSAAISEALSATKQWKEAERLALTIEGPWGRVEAMALVAIAMARSGQIDEATALALRAERSGREAVDEDDGFHESSAITQAIEVVLEAKARDGGHNEVIALARHFTEPADRHHGLVQAAIAAAGSGHFASAEAIADSIERSSGGGERAWALAEVSLAAAQARQKKRAVRLLCLARTAAKDDGLERFSEARTYACMAITSHLTGDREQAARHLADARCVTPLLGAEDAMRAAFALGDHDLALEIATGEGPGSVSRAQTLAEIVDALASGGEIVRAEGIVKQIQEPYTREEATIQLARAHAVVGEQARAVGLARSIESAGRRGEALAAVAAALLVQGNSTDARLLLDEAERAGREETNHQASSKALQSVIEILVDLREHGRASALASAIEDWFVRPRVLVSLLRGLSRPEQSRVVAGLFRSEQHWTIPLDALAHVDPSSVLSLLADG